MNLDDYAKSLGGMTGGLSGDGGLGTQGAAGGAAEQSWSGDPNYAPWNQPKHTCPNCGYCPHCGRGGGYVPCYPGPINPWPPYTPYPTWPKWNEVIC